jgi:predicted amidohydrolase
LPAASIIPQRPAHRQQAALIQDGRVVFEQSKMLLPTYDVFDESRYFQPGEKIVYGMGREQLGITICEDVWNDKNFWAKPRHARDPVTELVQQGTSILLNISASPYTSRQALLAHRNASLHRPTTSPAQHLRQPGWR